MIELTIDQVVVEGIPIDDEAAFRRGLADELAVLGSAHWRHLSSWQASSFAAGTLEAPPAVSSAALGASVARAVWAGIAPASGIAGGAPRDEPR